VDDPRAKLFVVKPEDFETQDMLDQIYPQGVWNFKEETRYTGKNFLLFMVPPQGDTRP
jgi:hypothetical protein